MPDWVKFILFVMLCFGPFWLIKVYHIVRSNRWPSVIGTMTNIHLVEGADEGPTLTVGYEFDHIKYVENVTDFGSLDLSDNSQIGRKVILLINPANPKKCMVRNDGRGLFNKSALIAANFITRLSKAPA